MVYQPKPLIGLNADYKLGVTPHPSVTYLFSGYYDSLLKAGAIPVILPPYSDPADLDQLLPLLDGLVLVGGADLDPRHDGYMLHPSLRVMEDRREQFDRLLIRKAYERRLPVFGIGAGMQLMNVTFGGTLFLHIPEDLCRALPHRDSMDPYHRHAIVVEKNSLFGRVYGDNEIRVNSNHHMAIDDVAPGFLVTARCPDSVIEGIESTQDDWFALGTQFHPESTSATALDLRIFQEFVSGIVVRSNRINICIPENSREEIPAERPAKKQEKTPRKRRKTPIIIIDETDQRPARSRKLAQTVRH